ncbi:molybdopterin oxidoreductase family protein [Chromatocurvus halotolerans]|uniref:Anaerobic selenocysteine-containing dehydrogenase n=1 Tax=Chromatocurvus halotolerans TaxID=1132028 RepID=A0A4R2KPW0_9GAMM|nr:molybdopterin oxidoreductase family protein [Chromatocurvus halotolerans]TCO74697.1 anaerobic selenocysteine-containing dehydrogenase [Chromatocurvus halotolerans]
MPSTHHRACHLCEAICGLVIETEGQTILSIKGDPDDPLSRGHICPKAIALRDIHEDPDRLRQPIRKVRHADGHVEWQEISWDEALDATADALFDVHERHGVDAIGVYLGNPTVHNIGMMTHQNNLFRFLRTRNRFSATSVDQLPHHLVALWLFGHKAMFPIPDIDNTDYFLMLGANPVASNGSIWTVPDIRRRIRDLKARGGRLVVLDPRRTETADMATEHHFIRPGNDALFLAALLQTLFHEGLAKPGHLTPLLRDLDSVADAVRDFTPESVTEATGIAADTIRGIARDLASAPRAICYGRMGVSTQEFGTLCQWLIAMINIATGNLDRPGGSLFTLPAVDQVSNTGPGGFARHHSRVRQLPEFDRELPSSALADEITTPGEGQIRALFTGAGNPVLSTPNGRQLDEALASLEFMVSLDPYLNETTRHADIILPPTSPLEHDHYDLAFHMNAMRNTARYNPPIFERAEGCLHDWEIFSALGERIANRLGLEPKPAQPPHAMIDAGLRAGPYSEARGSEHALTLEKLKRNPSGIDLGPLQPQLPERLFTADHMIHCAPPPVLADLDRLRRHHLAADNVGQLRLIGRRHVRSNNSWMHNYHRLVKGRDRCALMVHPDDLAARGLADGARAELASRTGTLTVTLEASEDIMPGVVSLPHGYGHDRAGIRMQTARANAGVSCNDITDDRFLDGLSGNAAVNGVPVTLAPCDESPLSAGTAGEGIRA